LSSRDKSHVHTSAAQIGAGDGGFKPPRGSFFGGGIAAVRRLAKQDDYFVHDDDHDYGIGIAAVR
jgi:hypothetical protein